VPNNNLTRREREVVAEVAKGSSNRQIGTTLGISLETVKEHVQNALRKLQVDNRVGLAAWHMKQVNKPETGEHVVFIVFGSASTLRENQERCINEYRFDTLAELNAFLKGVDAADGWSEYHQADTREEALAYIKEATRDCPDEDEDEDADS
jgi:DNA-binding CsgD family transcriptional regulator